MRMYSLLPMKAGNEHTLVVVNNNLHSSEGWLKVSSARLVNELQNNSTWLTAWI